MEGCVWEVGNVASLVVIVEINIVDFLGNIWSVLERRICIDFICGRLYWVLN